ncbi:MAG: hypothetical protein PHF86_07555 [Candidatus Nanoarchaeia archaeon]|nr:hypothetical protein [Candidatus Nanoarchaeia archaeon]
MSYNERIIDTTLNQTILNLSAYLLNSTDTIRIPNNSTITQDVIVAKTCSLLFLNGSKLIHNIYSITFNGSIIGDPMWKIFEGTGTVIFNPGSVQYVRPEWWGVDYTLDCTDSLQKAINSVSAGGTVLLSAPNYVATGPLTNNANVIIINNSNFDIFDLLAPETFSKKVQIGGSFESSTSNFSLGASIPKLTNLITEGFVKTSGEDGTLIIDPSPGGFGETGVQGETGLEGLQGDTGLEGPQGETGVQGLQGETGLEGLQGETGVQGLQGETGVQGETGLEGPQGDTGVQGLQGLQGDTGLQGETGLEGLQGDTGVQGERGLEGLQGDTGLQGETG